MFTQQTSSGAALAIWIALLVLQPWQLAAVLAPRVVSYVSHAADADTAVLPVLPKTREQYLTTPLLGRRSLLASGAAVSTAAACSALTQQLFTNGYFKPDDLGDMHNALLMASLSNDIYPWAKQYGYHLADVVDGLDTQQTSRFEQIFGEKYTRLGALDIQFISIYDSESLAAGHAAVFRTPKDVFVVFRGTADFGQIIISGNSRKMPWTIFGTRMQLFYPPHQSMKAIFPEVRAAVSRAVAATDQPSTAKVYLAGHSLGGASACLGALLLKEQGFNIAGVWAFDPYKVGTTCSPNKDCWVSVYDRHLANSTWMYWNNQDPIPQLVDAYQKTSVTQSEWGHVPRDRNWVRIVGDRCLLAAGTPLMEACPPEIDAADGKADGSCPSPMDDHMPWNILRRIAGCVLLQSPTSAPNLRQAMHSSVQRIDGCSQSTVWTVLLGLSGPSSG